MYCLRVESAHVYNGRCLLEFFHRSRTHSVGRKPPTIRIMSSFESIVQGGRVSNYSDGGPTFPLVLDLTHYVVVVALTFTVYDYVSTAEEEVRGLN